MYPPSITVSASVSVRLSSLWLSFPFLCKAVGHGEGAWDDPSEQPWDGKAEFPADEEWRDDAGVTRYWGLSNNTAAALATFALLWGCLAVGQFFSFFHALILLFFPNYLSKNPIAETKRTRHNSILHCFGLFLLSLSMYVLFHLAISGGGQHRDHGDHMTHCWQVV